jgi:transposase
MPIKMSLTDFTKGKIISMFENKITQVKIAKKLKIGQSTVSRIIAKYKKTGHTQNIIPPGRPSKTSSSDFIALKKITKKKPKTSLRKLSVELKDKTGICISHTSIKNKLNKENIFAFPAIKKPFLSKKNIAARVEHTRKFIGMSNKEIKKIIFTDESKFNLVNSDGKCFVWREPSTGLLMKNLTPTVKFGGGSVMVWGCFSYHGVGQGWANYGPRAGSGPYGVLIRPADGFVKKIHYKNSSFYMFLNA